MYQDKWSNKMDNVAFDAQDFQYLTNYLKMSYEKLPEDYIRQMSYLSKYVLNIGSLSVNIGYELGFDQVLDNINYVLSDNKILKIGSITGYGSILYADITGDFKLYYVDDRTEFHVSNLKYLCDSISELNDASNDLIRLLEGIVIMPSLVQKISFSESSRYVFGNYDFELIRHMIGDQELPNDFLEIFSYNSCFHIDLTPEITLTIGSSSAKQLCFDFNSLAITAPHSTFVIGIDGYGNSLVYSNKDGKYKVYIVSDSNFDEDKFVYLADNLYELLIDKKNLDVLADF